MAWKKTRNFAIYFLPWFLFGIIYDSMRLYPNYKVNSIDVIHLYEAEKYDFGNQHYYGSIESAQQVVCHDIEGSLFAV